MNNNICTSIEQSKKLIELGIDANTANMCYRYKWHNNNFILLPCIEKAKEPITGDIPAWSLSAMLDILPLEIEIHKQTDGYKIYYYIELYMKSIEKKTYLSTERHENLIDACVEMIIKLHGLNIL